jgi:Yip1 domain
MSLVERVKNILMSPQTEWPVIAGEGASVGSLYTGYIIPLAAIPAISTFISLAFFSGFGIVFGLVTGVVTYVISGLIGTFIVAFVAGKLAPSFGGRDDLVQGLKLAAYSYTASWVAGLALLIPGVGWLIALVAGLYGLYLLYLGATPVMSVPQDKSVVYTIVLVIVAAVVAFLVNLVGGIFIGIAAMAAMH